MRVLILLAALVIAFAGTAQADNYALVNVGNTATINGAIFTAIDPQPMGTGYIDPFLKFQRPGSRNEGFEQAYNFDLASLGIIAGNDAYGTDNWTHLLETATLGVVTVDGVDYWQFILDIDQAGNKEPYVTLDYLQLWTSDSATISPTLTEPWDFSSLGGASLLWDMNAQTTNHLVLNYAINSGSGTGDLNVLIPVSTAQKYIYLANGLGFVNGVWVGDTFYYPTLNNDGPEEWMALTTTPTPVPESGPMAMLLGMALLALAGVRRLLK
jgi:hypothetical protein